MVRCGLALASLLTLLHSAAGASTPERGVLNAGFVVTPGVYNSELMAPYDVLQHSAFRDPENYVRTFIVTETGEAFESFEGIRMIPHHSFEDSPPIDILLIPSAEHSMGSDLENPVYIEFLTRTIESARYVITLCDGAFPLAATGALDGRVATTFPGDRDRFAEMFPRVDVRHDVRMVVDGKFITTVGGAPSYEPAFYLVETLYGKEHADQTAKGLVMDWNLDAIPHLIVRAD